MSFGPPGANGTMRRNERLGKLCAAAGRASASDSSAQTALIRILDIGRLPGMRLIIASASAARVLHRGVAPRRLAFAQLRAIQPPPHRERRADHEYQNRADDPVVDAFGILERGLNLITEYRRGERAGQHAKKSAEQ